MNKFLTLTAFTLSGTFSLMGIIFPTAVKASNDFDVCLKKLTASGIEIQQAQTGCADALVPTELGTCVTTIIKGTNIIATDALKSCYQVRRPIDMGNCVVSINKNTILSTVTKTNVAKKDMETVTQTDQFSNIEAENITTEVSPVMMALNTCQASLLPARHSQCVIALSRTPNVVNPTKVMETCLSAEDFPKDLFPSYQ